MKITFEINPGKDIDATDLTQLLQWAQRCDSGVAVLGEAIGSLQLGEPVQLQPYEVSSASVSSDLSISGQIMQQISSPIVVPVAEPVATPAPTTPEPAAAVAAPKKRGRRSAAEIEADAKRYAEALKAQQLLAAPINQTATLVLDAPLQVFAPGLDSGVAVPPGMGVEFPAFTTFPSTPLSTPAPVQPQAPAMPVVPPGPPINGVGGELTVDEMRRACSQMNDVKQGMPYRVLKNFGFFTIEAVPADQRANLVEAMRTELSAAV